jgi:enoyl-CoA hydratase/carnithine racemase
MRRQSARFNGKCDQWRTSGHGSCLTRYQLAALMKRAQPSRQPHGPLLAEAFALAERILAHSPLAASRIITAVTRGINTPTDEGLSIDCEHFAPMVAINDIHESLNAWIARRTPQYGGT